MINAECHSDDRAVEVPFDATPWFDQANEEQVLSLARCEWRGDYPSDAVAHFMAEQNDGVAEMFKYLELRSRIETIGFECSVNEQEAMIWLKANRTAWWLKILQEA
jgi:hypothetical protein